MEVSSQAPADTKIRGVGTCLGADDGGVRRVYEESRTPMQGGNDVRLPNLVYNVVARAAKEYNMFTVSVNVQPGS